MRRTLLALAALLPMPCAHAITGDAPPAPPWAARPIVMVVDARGDLCTGTALARDLVLTAAHCVTRPLRYAVKIFQTGDNLAVAAVVHHPRFDPASFAAGRATADVALLKLAAPLPDVVVPAALAAPRRVQAGETLVIAGFGTTRAGTALGLGIPRAVPLVVTGRPGSLQIRLYDAATRNQRPGRGACTGDSGGPAFDGDGPLVIGVVSWTTAARDEEGCGGLTGLTPLLLYRAWLAAAARRFGADIAP